MITELRIKYLNTNLHQFFMIEYDESKETLGENGLPASGNECSENPKCRVISYIGSEILFVDKRCDFSCRYSLPFGLGYICTSKQRLEIFLARHI